MTRDYSKYCLSSEILSAKQLRADPMFQAIPPKFLLWQEGLVVRRRVRAGGVLCRKGDPGHTAFLIKSGKLKVTTPDGRVNVQVGPENLIVGEMSCMSDKPRTADVTIVEESEIWEIRRNVLDRLMRSPSQRPRFEKVYRQHSLDQIMVDSQLFQDLPKEEFAQCADFLRPRLRFVSVSPEQKLFRQGDWADHLYFVRLGHVRVVVQKSGRPANVIFRGPATTLGEIGLLGLQPEDANRTVDEINRAIEEKLRTRSESIGDALPMGRRTSTCSALDHVELARVGREDFLLMIEKFPRLRRRLVELALERLHGDDDGRPQMRQYIEQGLYQGQSLLVLDLTKCTRCDECTRACVDQHGTQSHGLPITRLLREGLRFDKYLVATSCRSCVDAYCMIGCPVDAIHRGKHQQVVIADHCIGCGLCANNCPYGNIWMEEDVRPRQQEDVVRSGATALIARTKAATCDLCDAEGRRDKPLPRCVHACPHDAAHRMSGGELLRNVAGVE